MYQIIIAAAAAILIALDQYTKWLALTFLSGKQPIVLIKGVLELRFETNPGIAFSLLPGAWAVTILLTGVALLALLVVLMSGKFRTHKMVSISGTLILAGGLGNLIDRVFRREVIDFVYFRIINFAVFNLADSCIVIGAAILLIYFIFLYKEEKTDTAGKAVKADGGEAVLQENAAGTPLSDTASLSDDIAVLKPSPEQSSREEGAADGAADADAPAGQNGGKA